MKIILAILVSAVLTVSAFAVGDNTPAIVRGDTTLSGPMMYPLSAAMGHTALETYIAYKDSLGLTLKQVRNIIAIRNSYLKEISRKSGGLLDLQSKMNSLLSAEVPDYKAVAKVVEKIENIQNSLRTAYFAALDKADNALSDDQKEYVKSMLQQMGEEQAQPDNKAKDNTEPANKTKENTKKN